MYTKITSYLVQVYMYFAEITKAFKQTIIHNVNES